MRGKNGHVGRWGREFQDRRWGSGGVARELWECSRSTVDRVLLRLRSERVQTPRTECGVGITRSPEPRWLRRREVRWINRPSLQIGHPGGSSTRVVLLSELMRMGGFEEAG